MCDRMRKLRSWIATRGEPRDRIPFDIQERIPLASIESVTFSKKDELTTDLICCEIKAAGRAWFFHEEVEGWTALVRYLERLPGFRQDWYASVVHPPFARSETVAFSADAGSVERCSG